MSQPNIANEGKTTSGARRVLGRVKSSLGSGVKRAGAGIKSAASNVKSLASGISNTTGLTYLTYALIISGYISTFLFKNGAVPGYSCVVAGFFIYMMLQLVPFVREKNVELKDFLKFLPMIGVLAIVTWTLGINIKYSKKIEEGDVTDEYDTFNQISFFLLLIQLIFLAQKDWEYGPMMIALVGSFQIVVVFIMQMNLEYFNTDG